MKKTIVTTSLILSSLLYASSATKSINTLYLNKEYKKAYDGLEVYLQKHPMSKNANILFANCAYNLGYYDKAMAAYDRVLILDEDNTYVRLQEAKVYIKTENIHMAKVELDFLLSKKTLSSKLRMQALELRKSIIQKKKEEKEKIRHLTGLVNVGISHTTNANDGIDKPFKKDVLGTGQAQEYGEDKKKDFSIFARANLSYDKNTNEFFGYSSSFDAYTSHYFDVKESNLAYLVGSVSPYFFNKYLKVVLPLSYTKVYSDNKFNLDTYSMGVELQKDIKNARLSLAYNLLINNYNKEQKDKNSLNHSISLGTIGILPNQMVVYSNLRYLKNVEKKDTSRIDVNYNSYGLDIGLQKELMKKLVAKFRFSYQKTSYLDKDTQIFKNKRNDDVLSSVVGLNYNITNSSFVDLSFNYTNKKSNQALYEYDSLVSTLSYTYKF